jgi:uncharacterized linocin/CFP29 family protein
MTENNPQVPWTDEQWARVNQVIQEEASRARVAATFLPLVGPLPGDTDFVRAEIIGYPEIERATTITHADGGVENVTIGPDPGRRRENINVADRVTIQLATLEVKVQVRGAQMADPEMRSVLALFRRAANVLTRLEDAVVFRGLLEDPVRPAGGLNGLPEVWEIHGGQGTPGLWGPPAPDPWPWDDPFPPRQDWQFIEVAASGDDLVRGVSDAIGELEAHGHFGPFGAVLGQELFLVAQTPDAHGYVLPQDRIIPFLGGGSLLRSSTLDAYNGYSGVVVALGGAPVELVVAADMSLQFLQVTQHPNFLFRVREKIALRIKEADAIMRLYVPDYRLRAQQVQ